MLCPHCKAELKIADRQGIEIDYCPSCRGVWLDRGELDKILERAATTTTPAAGAYPGPGAYPAPGSYPGGSGAPPRGGWRRDDDDDDYDDDGDRRRHYGQQGYGQPGYDPRRRKRSWLGDLFDFD